MGVFSALGHAVLNMNDRKTQTKSQMQKWAAENIRYDNGKMYQKAGDGTWREVPPGQAITSPTFGGGGAPGGGGTGLTVNFGGGGDRGATGPGGASFGPNTPTRPIPGSGIPPVTFMPPKAPTSSTPPPTPPPPTSPPVDPTTPGTTTPDKTDDGGKSATDKILDQLKKYGTNPKVLAALGTLLLNLRQGRQEGRAKEQVAATVNNTTNTQRYLAELGSVNQDLNQRNYLGDLYDRNRDNAIRGDYMGGVEDVVITPPPGVEMGTVTGGLRPSAFPHRKDIGDALRNEAMTELLDPTRMADDPRAGTRRLPKLPTLPEKIDIGDAGAFDKVLEMLGLGASAIPLINTLIDANKSTPKQTTPTWRDLPISAPEPLRPYIPSVNLGDEPFDPYSNLDSFRKHKRGEPGYDPWFPVL